MSLPDIRFESIRPHDGNRHAGFEEMCCQLASLEPTSSPEEFFRKGRGGDAGVECYRVRSDGTEVGWQAKYLFEWSDRLNTHLDSSIQKALEKHPRLVEYIVCLPFDLSDSRSGRGKTAREKWNAWCDKWKQFAVEQNRKLTITLWGKSELTSRLASGDPAYSGRALYWFDREALTADWFNKQFDTARASLKSRYTPETNVELPIRQDFLAFARHSGLLEQVERWFFRVAKKGSDAVDVIRRRNSEAATIHSKALDEAVHALTSLLDWDPIGPDQPYPIADWSTAASDCLKVTRSALQWIYELPPSNPSSTGITSKRWAQHTLHELMGVLREIKSAFASNRWQLTNKKAVLLQGQGGIGKSHLLANILELHLHKGGPGLLLLGGRFVDNEPWPQIRDQLDLPPTGQFSHFLGSLDAAAQVAGMRAIVCIDALNEANGIDVWPQRLAAFLRTIEAFPRVGVILSCRTTHVPYVIPDDLDEDRLFRVEHTGFAANGGQPAKVYLDKRGMARHGVPNLATEFENPLFLKTCCDSLQKGGKTEFPRGLVGVTSIFEFYYAAVTRSLNRRMQLDPYQEIVPRAIDGFAKALMGTGNGYVPMREAINLFESILASGGNREKSLLVQLESEGILTVELLPEPDGSPVQMVRFTFERFGDHAIALLLLDDHLDVHDVASSVQIDQTLHEYIIGPDNYKRAGIIEAMAVQFPERTGVEILDVGSEPSYTVRKAFLNSLLWRKPSHFTERTIQLLQQRFTTHELYDCLISVSTQASNKFNSFFVHKQLLSMTLPERDECWSVYLAERGFNGPIQTLTSWALQNDLKHIQEDRGYLAATMLTWFFTTSHREIRDKATKALARILSRRLPLAARLIVDFQRVNDLYVLERLLAACYGAALQGTERAGLEELAQRVFDTIFADQKPPTHALLREYAQGIVEYAAWCGVLPGSVELTLARPPYNSPWPIKPVPDKLIDSYTEDHGQGPFRDAICSSTVSYFGDFAKYVIDNKVNRWSPARRGTTSLPSSLDICMTWIQEFLTNATTDQEASLEQYVSSAKGNTNVHGIASTTDTERLESAELALQRSMTSDQWEDFRVRAKACLRDNNYTDQFARFNTHWGRRWICKRAHDLGWTSERFGNFDNRFGVHDTNDHRIERIGKKYQWLALQELVARMADNLVFVDSQWKESDDEPRTEWIARAVGLRDIDPSFLTTQTHYDGWGEWDRTWWVPFDPQFRPMGPLERIAWLESDSDIINDSALIKLCNPNTGRRWLALSGFSNWRGYGIRDSKKEFQRDTWFRLTCIVLRRKDRAKMIESLQGMTLTNPDSFPKIELHSGYSYLGEYHWHPKVRGSDDWSSQDGFRRFSVPIRPTVASYASERGGYDYSINQTISVQMPALWLLKDMELQLSSGRFPVFVNSDHKRTFYDPSVVEDGPPASLVDRDEFLRVLDRQDLSAIWVISGEKNVFGGDKMASGFGGCLRHTSIYTLDRGDFRQSFHTERIHPTVSQIRKLFGEDPIPSEIVTRP